MCEIDVIRTVLTTTCDCVARRAGYPRIVMRLRGITYPVQYIVTFTSSGTAIRKFVKVYTWTQWGINERRDWPGPSSARTYNYWVFAIYLVCPWFLAFDLSGT